MADRTCQVYGEVFRYPCHQARHIRGKHTCAPKAHRAETPSEEQTQGANFFSPWTPAEKTKSELRPGILPPLYEKIICC